MAEQGIQRWDLTVRGRHHRVEVEGSVSRTLRWFVDGDLVASRRVPVVLAFVLACAEINRRRKQDALKEELRAAGDPARDPGTDVEPGAARPAETDDEPEPPTRA